MFWGLVLEPGKRYSTTVEKSFHVSKAVLDCSSVRNDTEILNVMLETEGSESILCNLCKQKGILQENLDLNFMTGDRLTFECRGNGRVHLSGYLLPDDEDEMSGLMDEESDEDEESEYSASSPASGKKEKRKIDGPPNFPSKKKKITADEDDEEDDDEDISASDAEGSDVSEDMDGADLDDEVDDDSEDEESDDEDDEESPNVKQQKKNKTPNKQNAATPKKTPITNGLTPKSNKKTPGGTAVASPNPTSPKQRQLMEQGVTIRDLKVGTGPPVKSGKTVSVRYLGKFKEGGKVFDKSMKGDAGFKFRLGKGDVIKGWDIGIQGMKVGGKRIIHCPPEVAYGAKGAPPKIPPNSALVFEVEVLNVN